MLTTGDMLTLADLCEKAGVRFRLSADNVFPTGMDRELAIALVGRMIEIIKSKTDLLEEVSEGGRTPLIRRIEDDDGQRLRGESNGNHGLE